MTDKQAKAQDYLKQYYYISERIKRHLSEMECLKELSTKISSPNFSSIRVTSSRKTSAPFENAVLKLADMEKKVDKEVITLCEKREEINNVINALSNYTYTQILQLRYIDFMKWDEMEIALCYTSRHLHRLHQYALNDVAEIIPLSA